MFFFRDIKAPLSQIRVSLVSALGAGQIIFFAGIGATENKVRIFHPRNDYLFGSDIACMTSAFQFMSQAGRMRYFALSATRARSAIQGEEKSARVALRAKYRVRPTWLIKHLPCRLVRKRTEIAGCHINC